MLPDFATFNRNLLRQVVADVQKQQAPPAPVPIPPATPAPMPEQLGLTGSQPPPREALVLVQPQGGQPMLIEQSKLPIAQQQGYTVLDIPPTTDPRKLEIGYADPHYAGNSTNPAVLEVFGYTAPIAPAPPPEVALENVPITSAVYGHVTDPNAGAATVGVNAEINSPDAAVRILASAPDGTMVDPEGNPIPQQYWIDLLAAGERGEVDLVTPLQGREGKRTDDALSPAPSMVEANPPEQNGPVTAQQVAGGDPAMATTTGANEEGPIYTSRPAVEEQTWAIAQTSQGGQTAVVAMPLEDYYRYFEGDPAYTPIDLDAEYEQIIQDNVRIASPETYAAQEAKGIEPTGGPDEGRTLGEVVTDLPGQAAGLITSVFGPIGEGYDTAQGTMAHTYLTSGNPFAKSAAYAILPSGAPSFLDANREEAMAIWESGYDRDGDGTVDVEPGADAMWAYLEDNGYSNVRRGLESMDYLRQRAVTEYADAVVTYEQGGEMSPEKWYDLIVGTAIYGTGEGFMGVADLIAIFDSEGLDTGGLEEEFPIFMEWVEDNPDTVTAIMDHGYDTNGDGKPDFDGSRAVWEAYVGTLPTWRRAGLDVLTDPLTLTPGAARGGRTLTSIGENIVRQADTPLARSAGRAVRTVGQAAQIPYRAFDEPVDRAAEALTRLLRRTKLLDPTVHTQYTTTVKTPITTTLRDIQPRQNDLPGAQAVEPTITQPPLAGPAAPTPEPPAPGGATAPEAQAAQPAVAQPTPVVVGGDELRAGDVIVTPQGDNWIVAADPVDPNNKWMIDPRGGENIPVDNDMPYTRVTRLPDEVVAEPPVVEPRPAVRPDEVPPPPGQAAPRTVTTPPIQTAPVPEGTTMEQLADELFGPAPGRVGGPEVITPGARTPAEEIAETLERSGPEGRAVQPESPRGPVTPEQLGRPMEGPDPDVFSESAEELEAAMARRTAPPAERQGGIRDQLRAINTPEAQRALSYYESQRRILQGTRNNMEDKIRDAARRRAEPYERRLQTFRFNKKLDAISRKIEADHGVTVRPIRDVAPFDNDVETVLHGLWDDEATRQARGRLHAQKFIDSLSDEGGFSRLLGDLPRMANNEAEAARVVRTIEMADMHARFVPDDPANAALLQNADLIADSMEILNFPTPDTRRGIARTTPTVEAVPTTPNPPSPGAVAQRQATPTGAGNVPPDTEIAARQLPDGRRVIYVGRSQDDMPVRIVERRRPPDEIDTAPFEIQYAYPDRFGGAEHWTWKTTDMPLIRGLLQGSVGDPNDYIGMARRQVEKVERLRQQGDFGGRPFTRRVVPDEDLAELQREADFLRAERAMESEAGTVDVTPSPGAMGTMQFRRLTPEPTKPPFNPPTKRTRKVGDYNVKMSNKGDQLTFTWSFPRRGRNAVTKELAPDRSLVVNWQELPTNRYDLQQDILRRMGEVVDRTPESHAIDTRLADAMVDMVWDNNATARGASRNALFAVNDPRQAAQRQVRRTGTIPQAIREIRNNWTPYEPAPRNIDIGEAANDRLGESGVWELGERRIPLSEHQVNALNIMIPAKFERPKMRRLREQVSGKQLTPDEMDELPEMVRARDKFDELYKERAEKMRKREGGATEPEIFLATIDDMSNYLESILRGMDDVKYRNGMANSIASVYRTMIALARESTLYSPFRALRYITTTALGNTAYLGITQESQAIPQMLRTVRRTFKAYNEGTDTLRTRLGARGVEHPAILHAQRYGASVPDDVLAVVADEVDYSPSTTWNRAIGKLPIIGQGANFISPVFASKTARNFAHTLDLTPRLALHDSIVVRNIPEANRSLTAMLADQGVDEAAITRWLTDPDVGGMVDFDDVRMFAKSQGLSDKVSMRMARSWDKEIDRLRSEAAATVRKKLFYGTTRADELLGAVFMFHYWMMRASAQYTRYVLGNPAMLANYYRMSEGMERARKRQDVPEWLDNMVKVLVGPMGYEVFMNPVALFETFLFFNGGRFSSGYADEDANAFFSMMQRSGFMPAAPLAAAFQILGYGGSGTITDPVGLNIPGGVSQTVLNVLQAHGYIDVNDGNPIPNPSQEFLRFWQEKFSGFLPGSMRIPDPVDEDLYDREINELIVTIAMEEGIIDEDLATRAREAEDMNTVLPPEVTLAFNNPDDPLWQEAYRRVANAKAGMELVRASPAGALYPYARPAIRSERDQQWEDVDPGSPEEQQLRTETALTGSVSPEASKLIATDAAADLLGDPETREALSTYYAILFGGDLPGVLKIDGRSYDTVGVQAMGDTEREALADDWLEEQGMEASVEALQEERKAFRDAPENADYAEYVEWRNNMRDVEGGPAGYWEEVTASNENARWWFEHLDEDQQANPAVLTSVDAYMAWKGIRGNYRTPEVLPLDNPSTRPYDPAATEGGGEAPSSGGAPGEIRPEWIIEDIQEYQAELAAWNQTLRELFPGQNVDINAIPPNVRESVRQNIYDRTGMSEPRLSSRAQEYLMWASRQEGGADTSIEAWLEWREGAKAQAEANFDTTITLDDGTVVNPAQLVGARD